MALVDEFDAVVMLTWSDWKTEPRSNRYHYAARFSRFLPVLFFQHRYMKREGISAEPTELVGVDMIHVSCGVNDQDVKEIRQLLNARGIRRPLLWIYDSMNYMALIKAMPNVMRIYHATEDYLTDTGGWNQGMEQTARSVINLLPAIDFIVFVSHGIVNSYYQKGGYKGPGVVIENGCDAEYFLQLTAQYDGAESATKTPVAIFQGGINQRLDYKLMLDLIELMPDWEFHFCGASVESDGWNSILKRPNVRYFGAVPPEEFARRMYESTVGLITYIQDQWIRNSLPLKAYEYVACGLPVVSVPITALERDVDLIAVARTASEFEAVIRRVARSRRDPESLQRRRQVALKNSYDGRFSLMVQNLLKAKATLMESRKKLRVAILYDCMNSMHVSTIREHLDAFGEYSRHFITYIPATPEFWKRPVNEVLSRIDLSIFDAVVIHYSTRLSVTDHLEEGIARALENFEGLKVLFMQDEYEGTEIARAWMDRLKFNLVYTCVPPGGLEYVYPSYRFPSTDFLPTLTGYVPEDRELGRFAKPLAERKLLIAYRGRKLPEVYGELGFEKYRIGVDMKANADERRLAVDIEVEDSKRIYGSAWYEFLGSARATLGTESGANVFDFDGSLRTEIDRLKVENPKITFREISAKVLAPHEGRVLMNQISPKIFEAIRLRTALVLFEGGYSGVVRPGEHYISLKKDFSNIDEVLAALHDDEYLQKLTDRAYQDVIASERFSYKRFVEAFDADIQQRVFRENGRCAILGPLFFMAADGSLKQALPVLPVGISVGPHPLGCPLSISEIAGILPRDEESGSRTYYATIAGNEVDIGPALAYRTSRWVWHRLPVAIRANLLRLARTLPRRNNAARQRRTLLFRITQRGWHLLPSSARLRIARLLERMQ